MDHLNLGNVKFSEKKEKPSQKKIRAAINAAIRSLGIECSMEVSKEIDDLSFKIEKEINP